MKSYNLHLNNCSVKKSCKIVKETLLTCDAPTDIKDFIRRNRKVDRRLPDTISSSSSSASNSKVHLGKPLIPIRSPSILIERRSSSSVINQDVNSLTEELEGFEGSEARGAKGRETGGAVGWEVEAARPNEIEEYDPDDEDQYVAGEEIDRQDSDQDYALGSDF